jgi:histidinol phosphatase-like enzyme
MLAKIRAQGGDVNAIYFCPHTPEEGCDCRKPAPGMIIKAQKEHHVDLAGAYMVGDSAKDILCARGAGVGYALLVKTGNFDGAIQDLSNRGHEPDAIVADLYDAVEWIIEQDKTLMTRKNNQSS